MYRVMLSYPLFGSGMRRLEQETDLFVTGCGELAPYEAQFLQADAFITRNVHPDKALIAKTTKLKVIGIPGVGYQGYDLEDLTNRGIALVYCPGMNGRSVAEHAMGLVYALTKQIVRDDREGKAGNYAPAFIGIGKAYYEEGDYHAAMDYFKLGQDRENYGKAYKMVRNNVLRVLVPWLCLLIMAVFLYGVVRRAVKRWRKKPQKKGDAR